ncbi:MAG: hypothetical protein ABIY71_09215, partial [Flavobacteriales bacterium]
MKPVLLLCACSFAAVANATVYTVSNEPGYPAQYNNLQAAHDAAAGGDTLYVTPSATNYGDLSVDRAITVIGGGYGTSGAHSQFSSIYCLAGSSGSRFIGLYGTGYIYPEYYAENSNILVERCQFNAIQPTGYAMDGLVVKHSVISAITMSASWSNVLITNNLITAQV